jgi:hypothetical protein
MPVLAVKNLFANDIPMISIKPIFIKHSNIHSITKHLFIHHRGHCINIQQVHQYPNANSTTIAIVKLGNPKITKKIMNLS